MPKKPEIKEPAATASATCDQEPTKPIEERIAIITGQQSVEVAKINGIQAEKNARITAKQLIICALIAVSPVLIALFVGRSDATTSDNTTEVLEHFVIKADKIVDAYNKNDDNLKNIQNSIETESQKEVDDVEKQKLESVKDKIVSVRVSSQESLKTFQSAARSHQKAIKDKKTPLFVEISRDEANRTLEPTKKDMVLMYNELNNTRTNVTPRWRVGTQKIWFEPHYYRVRIDPKAFENLKKDETLRKCEIATRLGLLCVNNSSISPIKPQQADGVLNPM